MSDTFLRYLLILQEMPQPPRRTDSAALALRLEELGLRVTRRTLQRDLEKLSRVLPIECTDTTKPYGWSWRPEARSPLPQLASVLAERRATAKVTPSEAVLTVLDHWRSLGDGRFEAGLAPFFAVYLRDAVARHTGLELADAVIPIAATSRVVRSPGNDTTPADARLDFALSSRDQQIAVLVRVRCRPSDAPPAEHEQPPSDFQALVQSALGRPFPRLRVVFVECHPTPGRDSIGLAELAQSVERDEDPQSRCFARYLRRWGTLTHATVPDGSHAAESNVIPFASRSRRS